MSESNGDKGANLGVKATFYLPDKPDHDILQECEEIRPVYVDSTEEFPEYVIGSHEFSGRHDGGLLPPLKKGGPYGALVSAIQEAKLATDQFLTGLMREQSDQVDGSKGVVDNGEGALEVPDES